MDQTTRCPSCQRDLFPEDAYCSQCGTRIQTRLPTTGLARRTLVQETIATAERLNCASCNSPLLPADAFCSTCGARFGPPASQSSTADRMRAENLRKLEDVTRGRFEFIRELGRGGMGTVYLARETDLDRLVAIKVLSSGWLTDDAMVERFRREAKTIASLRHPSIVHVHGVGRTDELHYFIMDYIDGVSLGSLLRTHGPMSVAAIRMILYQVGSALSFAHRPGRGVIHRDVKPGNIMLDTEGNAFVTDFGISKASESQSGLTMTGLIMGTPEYMSPEQCRGDRATNAADQYALGAVAFAMLTGGPPFTGPHYRVLMGHTNESPPEVLSLRPDCPSDLERAVTRMLAKLPAERWPDIMDALKAGGARPLPADDPVREQLADLVKATRGIRSARPAAADPPAGDKPTWLRILEIPAPIEAGDEIPLRVRSRTPDGGEADVQAVTWESTNPSIARVDPDTGQLIAVGAGSAIITARAGGVKESIPVEILPARVVQLVLDPSALEVEAGDSRRIEVRPRGRRGQRLERAVLWSSSDPGTATISEDGTVHAHRSGMASVVAHCEGVGAAATITVVPAAVAAVVLVNAPASIPEGEQATLRAEVRDARGRLLERTVQWSSSDPALASIEDGLVRAIETGTVDIAATCDGRSASASIRIVPPPIRSISFDDPPSSIVAGEEVRLAPTLLDSRGQRQVRPVTWKSSNRSVAEVDRDGRVRAVAPGRAEIAATCEGVSARLPLDVLPVPVARIITSAPPSGLVEGDTFHLTASPVDSAERPLERAVEWSAVSPGVVESLGGGRFRALAPGEAAVSVAVDGVTEEVTLVVEPVRVASVVIVAPPATMQADDRVTLAVELHDQRGRPVKRTVRWSSSDNWIARVSSRGVLEAAGPGSVTITAEADGASDSAQIVVEAAPWATVVMKPGEAPAPTAPRPDPAADSPSTRQPEPSARRPEPPARAGKPIREAETETVLIAPSAAETARERPAPVTAGAATGDPGRRVPRWAIPAGIAAAAGATWLVFNLGQGGDPTTAPAQVPEPPAPVVTRIAMTNGTTGEALGGPLRITVGDTVVLAAVAQAQDGAAVSGASVNWSSADPAIASVDLAGVLVARSAGSVRISARSDTIAGEVDVVVAARPSARSEGAGRPGPTVGTPAGGGESNTRPAPPAEPPPADGMVTFSITPWARIIVDGQVRHNETDRLDLTLSAGRHSVRLENPAWAPFDTTITVPSARSITVVKDLRRR